MCFKIYSVSLIDETRQKLAGIEFLITERNKSVLNNIAWSEQIIINKATGKFGESIALDAVFANVTKDVVQLEAKEATLNQILISYAPPQPPAPTGKP
jgi:hypothetical protein